MKKILSAVLGILFLASCSDIYLPPKNVVTDEDLISSESGLTIYMARLLSYMPYEEFKYMAQWGFDGNSWLGSLGIEGTGEALNRDGICSAFTGENTPFWGKAFTLLHDINHLMETLPAHKNEFSEMVYNDYLGQAYFMRAYVFCQMARRFGGVPLVTHTIAYPDEADKLEVARSSEQDTWDQVLSDFDMAASLLGETSRKDAFANKYVALAFKAEAMLYAGCVAKYNETVPGRLSGLGAKTGVRVMGFDSDKWQEASIKYFSEAYKAARAIMKSGRYSLYRKAWKEGDREAMYKNMVDMFSDLTSPENIYVREYSYPSLTHGIDAYSSPFLWRMPLAGGTCPTLEFVELFDGFERYPDGHIRVTDGNSFGDGNYLMFNSTLDLFRNAEPRLRAYVILPGDTFRGKEIEVRTGIYTGATPLKPLFSDYGFNAGDNRYQNHPGIAAHTLYISENADSKQTVVDLGNGSTMLAAGSCGPFYGTGECTLTGFYLRKYLNPDPAFEPGEGLSDQPFILMRYADVLLAAAEAGVELSLAGAACPVDGDNMLDVATKAISELRERAGAEPLAANLSASKESRDIVRRERRKELAFEHKSKWDIRRWRVQHEEGREGFWGTERSNADWSSSTRYRFHSLYPFYSSAENKYFFDPTMAYQTTKTFEYSTMDYYFEIPSGEVAKSLVIDQQPNR